MKKLVTLMFFLIVLISMIGYFSSSFSIPIEKSVDDFLSGTSNLKSSQSKIEAAFMDNVFIKGTYINIYGYIQKLFDKKISLDVGSNTVIKLNNGYLSFVYPKHDSDKDVKNIKLLNDFLLERNINFLYIQAPFKINKYDNQLPIGCSLEDYSNQNADDLLHSLDQYEINCLDLRQSIKDGQIDHYNAFFKTDHHWKPETALWAAGIISEKLVDDFGFNININLYNDDNFNYDVKKGFFLGSEGKRVGIPYVGVDDFTIITPKFQTNLTFSIPEEDIKRTGEFKDSIYDYEFIDNTNYYFNNPYAAYTGLESPISMIVNNNDKNGKRILLIRDSFANTLSPFLALGCSELHMIDLRSYHKSIIDYINNNDAFDVVIIMYNPSVFFAKDAFVFDYKS